MPDDLTRSVTGPPSPEARPEPTSRIAALPDSIAGFRILRKIGEGGMGLVFEAEQPNPRRIVALKIIRGSDFLDETKVRLFEREVQTLARLKHPGIAAIYESGRTNDGRQYFAMELVQGVPLDVYLRETSESHQRSRAELKRRLDLFLQICDAIAYAHARGVIHRDLKPANVFVIRDESRNDRHSDRSIDSVKVLDFGLARMTDSDLAATTVGVDVARVQGTLAYMSPEQARGLPDEIDFRTDVYSLGMILYEMLTGIRAYVLPSTGVAQALRIICEEVPRSPSSVNRALRGDLETIALKALEKDPSHRYASVAALAEDLRRWIANLPVLARPPSAAYQVRKLVSRHRGLSAFLGAAFALLLGVAVTMSLLFEKQRALRLRADAERAKAEEVTSFLSEMLESSDPEESLGRDVTVRDMLDAAAARISTRFSHAPETRSSIQRTIGGTYLALGAADSAEVHLRGAIEAAESLGPLGDREVYEALHSLADTYMLQGRIDAADSALARSGALETNATWLTNSGRIVQSSETGKLRRLQGRFAEAESLLRACVAAMDSANEADRRDRVAEIRNLSTVLLDRGNYAAAESASLAGLRESQAWFGDSHPMTTGLFANYSASLWKGGRLAAAEQSFRELVVRQTKLFGPEHYEVAGAMTNLGSVLVDEGKFDEAEKIHREALRIRRNAWGPSNPEVAQSLQNIGVSLTYAGKAREGIAYLRDAVAMRRVVFGDEHPAVASALANLGLAEFDLGRFPESAAFQKESLAIREAAFGPQSAEWASSALLLGEALLRLDQSARADSLIGAAVQIRRILLAPGDWRIAAAENVLALSSKARGRIAEADSLFVRSLAALDASGSTPPDVLKRCRERARGTSPVDRSLSLR